MSKKRIIIGVSIVGVIAIGCGVAWFATKDLRAYNSAMKLYENEEYEEALKKFELLDNYKDSNDKINETQHMIDVTNDKTPPTISVPSQYLKYYPEDLFDFEQWASDNISVSDDVTDTVEYTLTGNDVDFTQIGEYSVEITAIDEAGNEAKETVNVSINEKPSPVYNAYSQAINLPVDTDSVNGISIISDEKPSSILSKYMKKLNQGAVYRSAAMKLEGFYVFGSSMYGSWSETTVKSILGMDKLPTWEEMKPYIDSASTFITRENSLIAVMTKLQSVGCVQGTFDFDNQSFNFIIQDLSGAANEMGISEEMLGYIIAMFDEYAPEKSSFNGNTYECSLTVKTH